MSTLSNLKVSTKLSLGFGFLVLLMLTIGIVSYNAMSGITNRMGDVIDDKVPKLEAIASINYKVLDIARSLRNALLEADDSEKMEGHIKRVLENRQEIKETLERLDPKVTLPEGRRLLKDIIDARTAFVQGQETVIRLLREKKTAEAKEFLLTEMRKRQGAYAAATGALQDFQKKVLHETGAAAQATAASASTTMLVAFLVSVLLAVVIAWLIIRDIVGQLGGEPAYAAEHVRHIALGDLSRRIETRPGDQGSLLVSLQQMQEGLARLVGEIREMVAAAAQGDFTRRIDLRGKQGFGKEIGESLNQLAETTDTGLADVVRVAKALAGGDLSQRIDKHYPGVFGETGKAVNATVEALKRIVSDIEAIAQAAAQGDFSLRADLAGKQGFARELSALLNQLSDTTESGLKDVMRVANTLARGDLTQVIDKDYPGLFGETRSGINATVANLGTLVVQIKEAVAAINVAAGEIAAGNQDLSSRTEEQASSLEETASSMEELNATVKNNTQSATLARTEALAATEVARRGGETVRVSMEAMAGIAESSNRIADIIGVIDGIAFQTNILALNAAVEAARAGEQGRGFAVVATEVRNLAQRSADAAKEIKGLIADSVARVEAGTSQAQAAGKQMGEIVAAIDKVSALISDIASASQEQASGIDQISLAVTQMDEVTQQNAALVEEAAAAAESLQEQAMHLATAVAVFRMAEGEGHRPLVPTAPRSGKAGGRSPARLAAPAKRLTLVATGDAESEWAEF